MSNLFKKKSPGRGGTKIQFNNNGNIETYNTLREFSKTYNLKYTTAVNIAHNDSRIKIIEDDK